MTDFRMWSILMVVPVSITVVGGVLAVKKNDAEREAYLLCAETCEGSFEFQPDGEGHTIRCICQDMGCDPD